MPVGVAPTFRVVARVGRAAVSGTTTSSLVLEHDGARYRARIGLIPTQAGVTAIFMLFVPAEGTRGLGRFLPFIALPPDAAGREQKAVLDDSFYVINQGKANNFDLYAQHVRAFAAEPNAPAVTVIYEQQSTFTVEVQ